MARSVVSGPSIVVGNTNPVQITETDAGPSLLYQGQGIIDPRMVMDVDAALGRWITGFYNSGSVALIDIVPTASAAGNIDSQGSGLVIPAGGSTTPRAINNVTAGAAVSPNIPLVIFPPSPTGTISLVPATLDFGFTTITGTSGNAFGTIPAGAYRYFRKGQAIAISGGSSSTTPLVTTVAATPTGTTLTFADNLGANVTNQPVGTVDPDLIGQSIFKTASGALPAVFGGCVALWDQTQMCARVLRVVSSSASDTGMTVTVRGWDMFGIPLTETISVTAGGTAYGKKAWKYVNTIQFNHAGGATTVGTLTLGTGDAFGLPLRSDFFEYMSIYWNAAFQTANTGWSVCDTTNPATATTGDVRGLINIGTNNNAGSGYSTAPNGSIRLAVFMSIPAYNAVNSTNINYQTLLGVTQFSG